MEVVGIHDDGRNVGITVEGETVGFALGINDGIIEGFSVGIFVGIWVGMEVGNKVVGWGKGTDVEGTADGNSVGSMEGNEVLVG
jgi:hypothetical protein